MSEDKHYNAPDPAIPQAMRDRKGNDMPAARTIGMVVLVMLGLCLIAAMIVYATVDPQDPTDPLSPKEQAP